MIKITCHGAEALHEIMPVMNAAFDPAFGEAWSMRQCEGIFALPGATLLAARAPGVVGFALVRSVLFEAELLLLAVSPTARGGGVARMLLEHSFDVAKSLGARHYYLEVRSDNPAVALYRSLAFAHVGTRPNYYHGNNGVHRDAFTLRRELV